MIELMVRLLQITSQMKLMILDPRRQLDESPKMPTISKEVQAGLDYLNNEKASMQVSAREHLKLCLPGP